MINYLMVNLLLAVKVFASNSENFELILSDALYTELFSTFHMSFFVLRPFFIEVEYYDIKGNKHLEKFEGFESTVLSHEMDHLDGILHMDVAEEIRILTKEERKKLCKSGLLYSFGNWRLWRIKKR